MLLLGTNQPASGLKFPQLKKDQLYHASGSQNLAVIRITFQVQDQLFSGGFFFFVCGRLCFWVASIFSCKSIHEARRKLWELTIVLFLRALRPVCLLFLFYRVLCLLYTKCSGCLVVLTRRNRGKWDTCLYSIIPETEVSGPHLENYYIR